MEHRLFRPLMQWTIDDVQALVDARLREGQRLDYKADLPLDREKDRAELAKDVSGMANAQGGLIIFGVAEDDSDEPRPDKVTSMRSAGQQTRIEDILDDAVQPRLEYEAQTLDADDGVVVLVRVAPRAGGPHMVQSYKQHRYFIRRGTRTVPMSEDEVRIAYEAARSRVDRVDRLLAQLPLLPRISRTRGQDVIELAAKGLTIPAQWKAFVSVVTAPFDAPRELVSTARVGAGTFPEPFDRYVGGNRRLSRQGYFRIDAFGLVEEVLDTSAAAPPPHWVMNRVRIYRQGVCEWAHRYTIPEADAIPSLSFAQDVHNALAYFASVYRAVGYTGRLGVSVRIDNAENATLAVRRELTDFASGAPARVEFINAYEESTVDALSADPLPIVRGTMELVWQAFGYPRCLLFDEVGGWIE
jgi:hypothetical protein